MKQTIKKLTIYSFLSIILFCLSACSAPSLLDLFKKDPHQQLIDYLIKKTVNLEDSYADVRYFDDYKCMIDYNKSEDCLSFTLFYENDNNILVLKDLKEDNDTPSVLARYNTATSTYTGTGYINRETFSSSNAYIFEFTTDASNLLKSSLKELFETSTSLLLVCARTMIESYDIDITLADLGFTNYN